MLHTRYDSFPNFYVPKGYGLNDIIDNFEGIVNEHSARFDNLPWAWEGILSNIAVVYRMKKKHLSTINIFNDKYNEFQRKYPSLLSMYDNYDKNDTIINLKKNTEEILNLAKEHKIYLESLRKEYSK